MQAIRREGDGPAQFELAAEELAFPLILDRAGVEYMVNIHLSPYAPREVSALLAQLAPRYHSAGQKITAEPVSPDALLPLFDAHFVRLSAPGREYDEATQKAFLAQPAQRRLKVQAVQKGYFGAYVDLGELPESLDPQPLDILGDSGARISVGFSLWDAEAGQVRKLSVTHRLRAEVERDFERYSKASRSEINSRRDQWQTITDHLEIGRLYDSMIDSLEGAVLNGQPCGADNFEKWVVKIPLFHKSLVMAELFREVRSKND